MLTEYKKTFHRKKITITFLVCGFVLLLLFFRLIYLMVGKSAYYQQKAVELHERERSIKAARGKIIDCNGTVLADNKRVCTISVIHNQIEDKEEVIRILCE
ncbi:MAG: peptidoglycan glycosyltransferase, partial [Lachnospiraceae bacterium]|nr:peptidoglycan glycosyltransferase [Lachnospiraceae bacterium]